SSFSRSRTSGPTFIRTYSEIARQASLSAFTSVYSRTKKQGSLPIGVYLKYHRPSATLNPGSGVKEVSVLNTSLRLPIEISHLAQARGNPDTSRVLIPFIR